jgi:hypothetical protein
MPVHLGIDVEHSHSSKRLGLCVSYNLFLITQALIEVESSEGLTALTEYSIACSIFSYTLSIRMFSSIRFWACMVSFTARHIYARSCPQLTSMS